MDNNFNFEKNNFPRGKTTYYTLKVTKMANGLEIIIPIHVINGKREGPVLGVISCVHGHEYASIDIIRQIIKDLNPMDISGTVLAIPVANSLSFSMATRGNIFDGLWGPNGDLARAFPGDSRGWIVERIAKSFSEHIVPKVDVLLDFHGEAPNRKNYIYYSYLRPLENQNQEFLKKYKDFILNLGTDLIVKVKNPGIGSINHELLKLGKIGIEIEVSDFYGIENKNDVHKKIKRTATEIGVTCVINTMKKMGMIEGKPKLPKQQYILDNYLGISPLNGGLMSTEIDRKDIGKILNKDDIIARVYNPFTLEEVEQIKAPFNKTILVAVKEGLPLYHVEPSGSDASGFEVSDWNKKEIIENKE
jgi:predicted deacylase